jgi:Ca2+/Na+ antiporter
MDSMLQKYTYSNNISKASKLYILLSITLPLAVSTIVLAWAEDNMIFAIIFIVMAASWSVFALYSARKVSGRKETDKAHHIVKETPRYRRRKRFVKTASLLILVVAIAMLVMVIIYDRPLYFALAALWWIIANGSEFIFVRILTDESVYGR